MAVSTTHASPPRRGDELTFRQKARRFYGKWDVRVSPYLFVSPFFIVFGALSDRIGRKSIILAGCLLSFFNLGAWGALYAIGPELYPSHIRGAGTGSAAGFGRIASIIAPLIVPPILLWGDSIALFSLFSAAFGLAAVATLTLPEQRGKVLDA